MKVIKIPSSQGGLGKADGAELAPDIIIEQMHDLFCNENREDPKFKIDKIEIEQYNFSKTNDNIYNKAKQIKEKVIYLGGDHSITFPLVKAFSENHNENKGIIIFDAHPDAENDFLPPTQEDLLPAIINQKIIKPENIILVGTRNWDTKEIEFLKEHKIKYFHMKEIFEKGAKQIANELQTIANSFNSLYISIDIDVLDPAFAPGTGYQEPGGLSTRELLYLLEKINNNNVKAIDIMEVCPKKDINNQTSKVAAKLVKELS